MINRKPIRTGYNKQQVNIMPFEQSDLKTSRAVKSRFNCVDTAFV